MGAMRKRVEMLGVLAGLSLACDPLEDDPDGDTGSVVDGGEAPADGGDVSGDGGGGEDPFGAAAAHNAVRQSVEPAASPPLPDLTWGDDLAAVAQSVADTCVFEHSDNDFGENLYAGTGTPDIQAAVDAWASEVTDYDYASNACSGVCGHYTQIVWRDTMRVGCAFADCEQLAGAGFGGRYWVCEYDPPGNFIGEQPY